MKQELIYLGTDKSALFVWATKESAVFTISSDAKSLPLLTLSSLDGKEKRKIRFGETVSLPEGIFKVLISPAPNPETVSLFLEWENGAYPFLLTGPGIWHARFIEETLHFPKGKAEVYIAVPEACDPFTVTSWRLKKGMMHVYRPSGEEVVSKWLPAGQPEWYAMWYETDIDTRGETGYYRMTGEREDYFFRLSAWNGYAMFLEKPDREFTHYAYFTPRCDEDMDYRVSIIRDGHIDVVIDRLYTETYAVPYIPGDLRLSFSAGGDYTEVEMPMPEGDRTEATVHFDRLLTLPEGWVRGDCHVHSGYEDACSTPRTVTKAARCNGLDFMFLTDHGGKNIIDDGLYTFCEEGRFMAYPGQECVNKRTHMNFLNIPINIDYKDKSEAHWLRYAKEHNPEGNVYAPMLNHPDHELTNTMANAYFRSWWVATEHKDEISLVENISSYRTLFDILNRGQKLFLTTTTDTHDGTKYKPGQNSAYVYTGGSLDGNDIVKAMTSGRFSHGKEGVFLAFTVDGQPMGSTLPEKESYHIEIELRMTAHQIKKVSVIRNGGGFKSFMTEDKPVQTFSCDITRRDLDWFAHRSLWVAVVGYGNISEHKEDQNYFNPRGIYAYANPVFIEYETDVY